MKKILAGVLMILSAVFLFASISVSAKTEIADNGKVYFAKGNAVYEMGENGSAKQIVSADKQILKIKKRRIQFITYRMTDCLRRI